MFKRVDLGEEMPPYHPSGCNANELFVILWKLSVLTQRDAQCLMIKQLYYWGIQT